MPRPPIRKAIGMLEARARFDADSPEVFIRTGRHGEGDGSASFIDLGDPTTIAASFTPSAPFS
jgi:hypothetical protein